MNETALAIIAPASVQLVVPVGRNGWARKEATLQYEANRLIKAEGIEFNQTGPRGLTGTLYLVKETLYRENRPVMRIERQKIVNGKIVEMQNWGEVEDALPRAA